MIDTPTGMLHKKFITKGITLNESILAISVSERYWDMKFYDGYDLQGRYAV